MTLREYLLTLPELGFPNARVFKRAPHQEPASLPFAVLDGSNELPNQVTHGQGSVTRALLIVGLFLNPGRNGEAVDDDVLLVNAYNAVMRAPKLVDADDTPGLMVHGSLVYAGGFGSRPNNQRGFSASVQFEILRNRTFKRP
jgi:hypothetical protein